jgi:predicted amidohydrolase
MEAAVDLVRERIEWCEAQDVTILCCPEGMLGGLADYAPDPRAIALNVASAAFETVLRRLASDRVATIVGFTELDDRGRLFNSAAICRNGLLAGLYRKRHPFINRSVYQAGDAMPVFTMDGLTFGINICLDSTFPESARLVASKGAGALFVPTNTGLPPGRADAGIVAEARGLDVRRAVDNRMAVVRADVAGRAGDLTAFGSSGIVSHDGTVLGEVAPSTIGIVVADISQAGDPRGRTIQYSL